MRVYQALAGGVLALHLLWVVWVILGVLVTRGRPVLRFLHIASLIYSMLIEILPWPPCPLTLAEQWLEGHAGIQPYHGPFLIHYLEVLIYPDIPEALLVACAVAVCVGSLGLYIVRYRRRDVAPW